MRPAAIEVQFSTDMENESKALLTGNEKESMDPNKLNVGAAGKEKVGEETKPEMKEGLENHYEVHPIHVTQSGCHDNVQCEEEFNARDLLCFAWQIARGMVGCRAWEQQTPKMFKMVASSIFEKRLNLPSISFVLRYRFI